MTALSLPAAATGPHVKGTGHAVFHMSASSAEHMSLTSCK
eukprot:CAMPEP_0185195444 /NCGR_PEP_ID=MMETSP1140-20130426/34581_1 /TAXON_ID=298111 /ORGANISM="Pavlova sp., Strain CCMP459" /LENGTH=39 /DNA_ID= /DNA_START= /DNA_END= /DNA_ORIENTATION=